jgi:hypothetical protein
VSDLAGVPALATIAVGALTLQRLDDSRWRILPSGAEMSTDSVAVAVAAAGSFEVLLLPEGEGGALSLSPDCGVGKHRACRGDAWNFAADCPTPCGCHCHLSALIAAANPKEPPRA